MIQKYLILALTVSMPLLAMDLEEKEIKRQILKDQDEFIIYQYGYKQVDVSDLIDSCLKIASYKLKYLNNPNHPKVLKMLSLYQELKGVIQEQSRKE